MSDEEITELAKAIQRVDNNKVIKLLERVGYSRAVDCTTKEGEPLLHVAILHHNHSAAKLLLDRGADPNFKDSRGRTALHVVAQTDNTHVVVDLLKQCSVNQVDENGDTALHVAVKSGSVEMVKWLVFAGADPYLRNQSGVVCRKLTNKNIIHQLLRHFNVNRPPMTFSRLTADRPHYLETVSMSMQLSSGSAADLLFFPLSHRDHTPASLGNVQEEERLWSGVVDYRLIQRVEVTFTFPLTEEVETHNELVLRSLDKDCVDGRDVLLVVENIEATPNAAAAAAAAAAEPTAADASMTSSTSSTSDNDVIYVAKAEGSVWLDKSGLLFLLHRPIKQDVNIGPGMNKVRSVVDPRVELSVPEDCHEVIQGTMQLEHSQPVKEASPLVRAPPARECVYECQTDYVKIRTYETSSSVSADLKVELPVPEGSRGGVFYAFGRTPDEEYPGGEGISHRSFKASPPDHDDESAASESEVEDQREAERWTRKVQFSLPDACKSMTVPLTVNETLTVVKSKKGVTDEELKRDLAKSYRKRDHKRAVFFLAGRPWPGWRECPEIIVVVTPPLHLYRELERHQKNGYCLLNVSGEFLVPPDTEFRVSVNEDDLMVHFGEEDAVITFQHVMHVQNIKNFCTFVLRMKSKSATQGSFVVKQKREKAKKTKSTSSLWKQIGELHFDFCAVKEYLSAPGQEEQGLIRYFNDILLLELAEKLPESRCREVGQLLGLSDRDMDRLLNNSMLNNFHFKCFELLRRKRGISPDALTYGRCVVTALRVMDCTDQCQWLLKNLEEWPELEEVES